MASWSLNDHWIASGGTDNLIHGWQATCQKMGHEATSHSTASEQI
ncbi:MAG TPA: hypothetical protein VKX46_19760 [Ktedonobacteraceae bacterium]|nr:hypothetical protein [Ktedonobacteraceae bacterium]HLI69620.1 hypothetical protein [Ktedonobacteraceae bacterium]